MRKYKIILFTIILLLCTILLTGCLDLSTETSSQNKNTIIKEGEEFSNSKIKILYQSVSDYNEYDFYSEPEKGYKVIRAEFIIENISNRDVFLNNIDCYADEEKCEHYYWADDYKSPTLVKLSAGKKMTAIVYYEVPINAKEIVLEYDKDDILDRKIEFIVK